MVKFILFDYEEEMTQEFERAFTGVDQVQCMEIDVRDLVKSGGVQMVVSPANSSGFMSGGIDGMYSRIFPDIQDSVQDRIKEIGVTDYRCRRPVIPVGSAVIVETNNKSVPYLIAAPTMLNPGTCIRNTYDVYRSFLAVLKVSHRYSIDNPDKEVVVACPGLGTGIGSVSFKDCADRMREAWDVYHGTKQEDVIKIGVEVKETDIELVDTFNYVLKY